MSAKSSALDRKGWRDNSRTETPCDTPAWPDRRVFLANENVRHEMLATALAALNMTGNVVVTLEDLTEFSPCDGMELFA
jgi:hypothetical protein